MIEIVLGLSSQKRDRELTCIRDVKDTSRNCQASGVECLRRSSRAGPAPSPQSPPGSSTERNTQQAQLPEGEELDGLIQLNFAFFHHFAFFAFIHPLHFQRLLDDGKAPRELTLMMIASALRFAAPETPNTLARADAWADVAINAVLLRIHQCSTNVLLLEPRRLASVNEPHGQSDS
ncbi:hypothetical protein BDW69DRAFT_183813 [Aspergillus filifer]